MCMHSPNTNTMHMHLLCCLSASQLVLQEVGFFDVTPVGELSNRLAEDTRAMKDAATTSVSMALRCANTGH